MQLVAGGDEQHVGAGLAGEVGQVPLPALAPGRAPLAGDGSGVGAAQDDAGDVVAEGVADLAFDRCAVVAVLDGVVQQAGDRGVLAAAVLEHDGGDGHEVGEVGDRGALADLGGVDLAGQRECLLETAGEHRLTG